MKKVILSLVLLASLAAAEPWAINTNLVNLDYTYFTFAINY